MLQSCEQMRTQMRRRRRECQRRSVCWVRDVSFTAATYWPSSITHEGRKTFPEVINQRVLSSCMHLSASLKQVLPATITSQTTSFLCAIWHSEQFIGHSKLPGNFYWQTFGDENVGLTRAESEAAKRISLADTSSLALHSRQSQLADNRNSI